MIYYPDHVLIFDQGPFSTLYIKYIPQNIEDLASSAR
jgi:hypothetical protein